ncbi:TspO/MBR family protein [Virgifigura deserti]|uniref:TspO/MBR family protein n=1 Tax=Virgifigura deserti TaxID=2268457 RepID=UPI003CCBF323
MIQVRRGKAGILPALPGHHHSPLRSGFVLIGFVGLCLAIGWIGSRVTEPALGDWYAALAKPSWTPPNAVFPVVWTVLYIVMAVAAWLVWRERTYMYTAIALPMTLFGLQLALNCAWSVLFFGLRSPGLGLIEIILLLAAILATMVTFGRVRPLAGWLLLPYLLWVGYAAALNFAIWRMN